MFRGRFVRSSARAVAILALVIPAVSAASADVTAGRAAVAGEGAATAFRQTMTPTPVADGITAFIAAESPSGLVQGNITVIAGSSATLVVDAGQYPALARDVVAWIRAQGLAPVRFLVTTHWHGDHLLATAVFQEAFPGLVVIQHAETARRGRETYADWRSGQLPQTRAYVADLATAIERGTDGEGRALSAETLQAYRESVAMFAPWDATADELGWIDPDITIVERTTVRLGGRDVEVRFPGKANTTGDLVVWDPSTRTLVTGDIVVAPTPYSFGSWHSEWIDTLAALRALAPARIVPGHGPVMTNDDYLVQLADLLAETRRQVRAAIAAGQDLEAVKASVTLPEFERRFAGDDPRRIRAFRQFYLAPGIVQAWKEAKGEPRSP